VRDDEGVIDELEASAIEALVEGMFLTANADGVVSNAEVQTLSRNIASACSGRISESQAIKLLDRARRVTSQLPRRSQLASIAERIPTPLAERALRLATRVAIADDVITREEEDVLLELALAMGIGAGPALRLIRETMS